METFLGSFRRLSRQYIITRHSEIFLLYGALRVKARETIAGYSITSENYKIVVDVLKRKYGDPSNIKMTLNAELMNLPRSKEDDHLSHGV